VIVAVGKRFATGKGIQKDQGRPAALVEVDGKRPSKEKEDLADAMRQLKERGKN